MGVCKKSPRKYPKKSKNAPKKSDFGAFLPFFGYFLGLFRRPPKRLFLRLFCDFGPGDSWRMVAWVAIQATRASGGSASSFNLAIAAFGGVESLFFKTPLACYRIGFGPPARNRKKTGQYRKRPLPLKIGKTQPKNRKNGSKIGFGGHFPIFCFFLSYFLGEAVSFFILFGAGGPKPIL